MINFCFQNLERLIMFQMISLSMLQQTNGQSSKVQFNRVIGHSSFIFLGTVTHMDSSNINADIAGKKGIVKVDEVIDASPADFQLKGESITVIFTSAVSHQNGDKQIFYTNGWSYGRTVGVIEVRNNLDPTFSPQLSQNIKLARIEIATDSLRAELRRSAVVAHCIVKSISDSVYHSRLKRSEHNPKLRKAIFEVKEVLKGKTKKDTLSAYFASSYDVLWFDAPKLSTNMEAIFLFSKGQLLPSLNIAGYTLLDPRDVQAKDQLGRLKQLLQHL